MMDGTLGEPAEGRDSGAGNSKVRRKSTKCGLQCNLQPTNTRKTAQYGVGDSSAPCQAQLFTQSAALPKISGPGDSGNRATK